MTKKMAIRRPFGVQLSFLAGICRRCWSSGVVISACLSFAPVTPGRQAGRHSCLGSKALPILANHTPSDPPSLALTPIILNPFSFSFLSTHLRYTTTAPALFIMSAMERVKSESEVSMMDLGDEDDHFEEEDEEPEAEHTEDEMEVDDGDEEEEEESLTHELLREPTEDDDDDGDFHG
ncbi:hypothetical protein BJ322DRAFT_834591 [Thelephora terrestris]|uniref:Uncharacterized protein n=1 Tax=Thelephora terrestris TaxID=56493 RepID=A0A9P6L7E5_9AGAM|nr:hypothetical protein BJ322DRAFT_834591 [Thelephora terrestris]